MREKRPDKKIQEKRGIVRPDGYEAWKRTNESKSRGTGSMIYDPIAGRTIDTLSEAETKVFWMLRFEPSVKDIYEQFPLEQELVDEICEELGVYRMQYLSTDFLAIFSDDSYLAVSVKKDRNGFNKKNKNYEKLIVRQTVEKIYWEEKYLALKNKRCRFRIVFGDEISKTLVRNIATVMAFWERDRVFDDVSKLKYLIAHGVIQLPLDESYIQYQKLVDSIDIGGIYERYLRES